MFLHSVGSLDARFKPGTLHPGLNLVVADRTESSLQGDSRNGTGKSSLVRILRFLMGGNPPDELKNPALHEHIFTATLSLPRPGGSTQQVTIARGVSTHTKVLVQGWSATGSRQEIGIDEWRGLLAEYQFGLPRDSRRPSGSQIWGQLIRTYFGDPTKTYPSESEWESGTRLGYLLGLTPAVISRAADVSELEKERKSLNIAVRDGALRHLSLDEAGLRSQLAAARSQRDRVRQDLSAYRVDDQYAQHQATADRLSADIRAVNDEAIALQRRATELVHAIEAEAESGDAGVLEQRLEQVYAETQLVLPDAVARRFEEVRAFNASVRRNRGLYLRQEQRSVGERLAAIETQREELDREREEVMRLLGSSVALDTFLEAQRSLAAMDADVAELERRLQSATSIGQLGNAVRRATVEAVEGVRAELAERGPQLDRPISLFHELGSEIYNDRQARLLLSAAPKGALRVEPEISGDASDGIRGVETFLLDMVSIVTALPRGRAAGLLVHDSHLFDAVDHRQVASCLNIGARLALEAGFQYVVTINSDFLASVESEGGFDRSEYVVAPGLTDSSEDGGIFGFRFD